MNKVVFFLLFSFSCFGQIITGAMINACGTGTAEGANEFLFFKNGNSALTVNQASIDIRYGTSTTTPTVSLTNSFGPPVTTGYVASLNGLLSPGCGINFVYAAAGSTIPANSNFILMNDDASNLINYSGWCNAGLSSNVYLLFSSSGNWTAGGEFLNSNATATRYFHTAFNGAGFNIYNYSPETTLAAGGWSSDQEGNFVSWSGPGSPLGYGRYVNCAPPTVSPLPIKLTQFTASVLNEKEAELKWETSSEIGFSHFEVQRSFDALGFESIGRENGKVDILEKNEYSFVDVSPKIGQNYYRLKQVDINGSVEFSKIIAIQINDISVIVFYPNPVVDVLEISGAGINQVEKIRIFNSTGKQLENLTPINNSINISKLDAQILFIETTLKDGSIYKKRIVKQ